MNAKMGLTVVFALLSPSLLAQDHPVPHHYFSKTHDEHVTKWGYSGDSGPSFWSELDPSYRLAKSGKRQSPIDINTKQTPVAPLPELKFDYRRERIAAINNGHTIQHNEAPGSFLYIGGDKFSLEQFHMHSPSEHTIDGAHFDLEIHFVHKSESAGVAVVGVLVHADDKAVLDFPLYNALPTQTNEIVELDAMRNPSDYLPRSRDYFRYSGSFTTPPCTEQVQWIVMKQSIGAPRKLIDRFAAILKSNNRPTQMLNDRVVERSK
jgi:carbonic anhydrase